MPSIADWIGSPEALPAFVRWQQEAEKHDGAGDYAWMAERLPSCRVLEVGCGVGFGTRALQNRGDAVLVLEPERDCIAIAAARCTESLTRSPSGVAAKFLQAGVGQVDAATRAEIEAFAPEWVVCWLMGADDAALDRSLPPAQAVQKYREGVHRQVAELAATLPSVQGVHLVDRTAFPWKIKDTARETLVVYHQATTFSGLPFALNIKDAVYRKLDQRHWPVPAAQGHSAGIVPVLGSLLARRT
jgi:SAM-dependent methyltransferase